MVDRTATFRKQSIALVPTWLTSLPSESPRSIGSIPPCFFADIEAVKVGRLQPCCTTFLLAYQFLFLARDKGNISESRKTGWTVERLKGYFGKMYRKHSLDKRDRYVYHEKMILWMVMRIVIERLIYICTYVWISIMGK